MEFRTRSTKVAPLSRMVHSIVQLTTVGCVFLVISFVLTGSTLAAISAPDFILKAAEIHERTIDFMVTVSFGLFAVFGFFIKDGLSLRPKRRQLEMVLSVTFAVSASLSLILAYFARITLGGQLASGTFVPEGLSGFYVWQAYTLLLGAAALFPLIALFVGDRKHGQHTGSAQKNVNVEGT